MSLEAVVIQGTLKPDGSLELDERPTIAPGRVRVSLQPLSIAGPQPGGLAETIAEIRRYQQAQGYAGPGPEPIASALDLRRSDEEEYERRMQQIWSQAGSGTPTGGG